MLMKCLGGPVSVLPIEGFWVNENHSYEDVLVDITDWHVRMLSNKDVASIKVLWRNHLVEGATWEA